MCAIKSAYLWVNPLKRSRAFSTIPIYKKYIFNKRRISGWNSGRSSTHKNKSPDLMTHMGGDYRIADTGMGMGYYGIQNNCILYKDRRSDVDNGLNLWYNGRVE
jgi:hypothetical protein